MFLNYKIKRDQEENSLMLTKSADTMNLSKFYLKFQLQKDIPKHDCNMLCQDEHL